MLPSACSDSVGVPKDVSFAAEYPACTFPLSTLRRLSCERLRMTRGQCGSLILHRMTLSFTTPRRFFTGAPELNTMFNKVILIGRLGQNAEAKTAQNNREYVVLNIATQESWKNDKGEYETRTEWHRVYAWRNLSKFAKTLQKGQLITLEGILRYREVEDDVKGTGFKHRIAEIHAISMKRLSKVEAADDPSDGADDE
jgi:single-strand DNA-binding protein